MKTTTYVCPTCGGILDLKPHASTVICKYCGNKVSIVLSDGEKQEPSNQKTLFSTLVERKFIYYIPHFDGVNDCYEFLLDYGEAAFLFEKRKDSLSEEEKGLVRQFFIEGRDYINNCVKANADKMIYSQLVKYEYAFSVLEQANLECGSFEDMHVLISNKLNSLPKAKKNEITVAKAKNIIWIILIIVILSIILLPGIIAFITGLSH